LQPLWSNAAITTRDYTLVGRNTALAIERGLAGATWYASPVSREEIRRLLERRDWPAVRDSLAWFGLIAVSGFAAWRLWHAGSAWAILAFLIYGTLYASTSDSRWHESSHGTAFRTGWLNDVLYEIASFMVLRESVIWRWSHARHHSDTYIVGRDPEIAITRPPRLGAVIAGFFKLQDIPRYFRHVLMHCAGVFTAEERDFVPASALPGVVRRAWIYLAVYASVAGLALYERSILPLLYIGLPTVYGSWLVALYGLPQHAVLAEDVLDHRLNTRTIYMNPVNRFLYWNMNYHVEHHMYPLVPYHRLQQLHELVKSDCPRPYASLAEAWREIIPVLRRQVRDPELYVHRPLPVTAASAAPAGRAVIMFSPSGPVTDGWIEVCASDSLPRADVIRVDHERSTYAIYRTADGSVYATDGRCTHAGVHLAGGLLQGNLIECPKHNGRFDVTDGSPQRMPACVALRTHPVVERDGRIFLYCKRLQS
jgi:Na+-transporting NADH:ubiquinone oxidoreductase subunit F